MDTIKTGVNRKSSPLFPGHSISLFARNLRQYPVWLLSSVCLFCLAPCHARDDDVSEQGYLQEFPVVLSASRLSQPASEAPNAVTVIDRDMIKASGFRSVVELFRLAPGMYVDYADGYTPFISYHGATDSYTRRMQVLVDGRSVYLQPFNTVNWEDLPLHIDDIERIEVVRGPAATSYGSNSILGVINIITRDASALEGASVSMTRGNAGNAGISDAVAHFGRSGEQLDYRLTFGKRSDNGFDFLPGASSHYNVENDSSATHLASLRANYHPGMADSFDLQIGFSNGVRSAGVSGMYQSPPHTVKSDSGYQQLTWLHALNRGDDLQLRYYHESRNLVDEKITPPYFLGLTYSLADNIFTHRHELELQHTANISKSVRLVWGAAIRQESVDAPTFFRTPQGLHQSRLFAHGEWRASPSLVLNIGGMQETDGLGHGNFSPRAALNYHITPEHTLRTGISVAYRSPSLYEERSDDYYSFNGVKYQRFHSHGGLRPEHALSREIGYLGGFANGLSVDMRAYSDQVSDIIWADPFLMPGSLHNPVLDFRNEFSAQYTGLEATIRYSWGMQRNNSLAFSYSRQNVESGFIGTPYSGASAWPFIQPYVLAFSHTAPVNSGSLFYTGQMGEGISFSAGYYQQGSVAVLDVYDRPQPLTRRVDMRMAKQFGPAPASKRIGGGEVALALQNAFQNSIVGYSNYTFDRRAYLTATINF